MLILPTVAHVTALEPATAAHDTARYDINVEKAAWEASYPRSEAVEHVGG